MSNDKKIDYIEFPAADFDAVQSFYEKTFGWTFTDYGADYRAFSDGRLEGGFYRADVKASAANGSALVVFYADHLEQLAADVTDNGGTISQEIFAFPGGRRFHFHDPHGNELAVWSDQK